MFFHLQMLIKTFPDGSGLTNLCTENVGFGEPSGCRDGFLGDSAECSIARKEWNDMKISYTVYIYI